METAMQVTKRHPSVATRRFGYVLATAITVVGWLVINVWPGWQELSFLTNETRDVLWLVNFSLAVSVAINLLYAIYDPPWLKSLGDLVATSIGLVVLVRVWQVFPFDFSDYSTNWAAIARVILVLSIVGSCIGILVQVVTLRRLAVVGGDSVGVRDEVRRIH
jgi:uncharacterized phage infection (PIP) family protein YhgE